MKKLLSLLGSITMIATPGATVIACGKSSSTTTSLDQDAVTKADYSIAAKNLSSEASLEAPNEKALKEVFQKHLIGYINPILKKLINRNVSDLEEQYIIEGLNIEQVKIAVKEVIENGKKTVPITGVTIRAKNAATDIRGKTTLGNVNVVVGRSITDVYNGENAKINIPIKDLDPTEAEIISYFNKTAKEDVIKEVKEIRAGHLTFDKVQRRNRVTIFGQGYFYDKIEARFDSEKATNIEAIIKQRDLGKIKFDDETSKEEQILAIVNENEKKSNPKFQDLTQEDVFISNITDTGANIEGVKQYKGNVNLTWEKLPKDLQSAISNAYLGAHSKKPELDRIIEILNHKNDKLNLQPGSIKIVEDKNLAANQIKIEAVGSDVYQGTAVLEWTSTQELQEMINEAKDTLANPPASPEENMSKSLADAIKKAESYLKEESTSEEVKNATSNLLAAINTFMVDVAPLVRGQLTEVLDKLKDKDGVVDLGTFEKQQSGDALKLLINNKLIELIKRESNSKINVTGVILHDAPTEEHAKNGVKGWKSNKTEMGFAFQRGATGFSVGFKDFVYKLSVE